MRTLPLLVVAAVAAPLLFAASRTDARAPASPVAAPTYEIDGVHSTVLFRVKHVGVSYSYGRFNDVQGTFAYDEKAPESSSVDVTVAVDSVDTANAKRDNHLKSPDFFNAAEHPTITFKSKSVKRASSGKLSVTGDLSLHGVTKSITAEVEVVGAGERGQMGTRAGFETTFTVKREDFGMAFMVGETGIGNEVRVTVSLEGALKQ